MGTPTRRLGAGFPTIPGGGEVLLGLLALLIGLLGQALLFDQFLRPAGAALITLAMLIAALTWRRANHAAAPAGRQERPPATTLRLAGILAAVLAAVASWLAWFADPDAIFGWQGVFWIASMALLLAACARWYRPGAETYLGAPWTRAECAAFIALLCLALFTYLADLEGTPWRFHYDEALAYFESLRFARGPMISLFTTTWWDTSLPSLWFVLAGGLMRLAGEGIGAVRLSVALAGACTLIPVYGIARLLGGRAAAILAGFAVATAPVAIHYARISIINITTGFAWAICFYFLLRGLRSHRPGDFVWSGIAGGLSMYTFYGTRLLPYLLLAFVIFLALFHRRSFKALSGHLALLAAGFVAGFGPLMAYFVRHPDQWAGRGVRQLNVPAELPLSWERIVSDVNILAPLAAMNFLSLGVLPSRDGFYWDTFVLPAQAVLLVLGAGILLGRWREPGAFLLILSVGGVVFVGGTLIARAHIPAFNHWTPAFPLFFVVLALAPAAWLRTISALGRRRRYAGLAALSLMTIVLAALALHQYWFTYPQRVPPSFEVAQGRFLAAVEPGTRVRFVGNSWQPFYELIGRMMAPRVPASDFLNPSRQLPLAGEQAAELVFIFNDDQSQYVPLLAGLYPGGRRASLPTPGGPIGHTYSISAEQVTARHGVELTLQHTTGAAETFWQGLVGRVGDLPPAAAAANDAVVATWSGMFFSGPGGATRFSSAPQAALQITVEGVELAPGQVVDLHSGWTSFRVRTTLRGGERIMLLAAPRAGAAKEIPRHHLWPAPPGAGLLATLGGSAISHRIDPFIGSAVLAPDLSADPARLMATPQERDPEFIPLGREDGSVRLIRWEGELLADGGTYGMELRTDGRARLWLDGALVLNPCDFDPAPRGIPIRGGYTGPTTSIYLTPGWHQVMLELEATGRYNGLEWTWTRPGGTREIVPPERLRHRDNPDSGIVEGWPELPDHVPCATP